MTAYESLIECFKMMAPAHELDNHALIMLSYELTEKACELRNELADRQAAAHQETVNEVCQRLA